MSEYKSFTVEHPPHGAVVLVRSLTRTWQGDRELHFDAHWFGPNNPRLLEPRTGIHLWYPERMEWKLAPHQPKTPTDDEIFASDAARDESNVVRFPGKPASTSATSTLESCAPATPQN